MIISPDFLCSLDTYIESLISLNVIDRVRKLFAGSVELPSSRVHKFIDFIKYLGLEFRDELIQAGFDSLGLHLCKHHPDAFLRLKIIEMNKLFGFQEGWSADSPHIAGAVTLVRSYDALADGNTKLQMLSRLQSEVSCFRTFSIQFIIA